MRTYPTENQLKLDRNIDLSFALRIGMNGTHSDLAA